MSWSYGPDPRSAQCRAVTNLCGRAFVAALEAELNRAIRECVARLREDDNGEAE